MRCLTQNPDRLYELVPVVYRLRDAEQGYPLKALLRVIAEQVNLVEQDIADLYDNWFIETCADWVVPYIGTLINYQAVHEAGEPTAGGAAATSARNRILFPRREVANTVRCAARALALQEPGLHVWLAGAACRGLSTSGFATSATRAPIQARRSICATGCDRELASTSAFSRRRMAWTCGGGTAQRRCAPTWRLRSYSITKAPTYCFEEEGPNCFLFNPLGIDTPLFTRPRATIGTPGLLDMPNPITRRHLERVDVSTATKLSQSGVPFYYGQDKSFQILQGKPMQPVPADQIVAADLSDWAYRPLPGQVAVDPELGRIMFPPTPSRKQGVWVSYHYGFSTEMGGGEYERDLSDPVGGAAGAVRYAVGEGETYTRLSDALTKWQTDAPPAAVIEITDSGVYVEPIRISLAANQQFMLRAANGMRPVIRLLDWQNAYPDNLAVFGEAGSWFTLDGFVVIGRAVQIEGDLAGAVIRHATLVPGWALHCNCEPKRPTEPSLEVNGNVGCLTIDRSITGAIEINRDQARTDPLTLRIYDSIVDAIDTDRIAIVGPGSLCAHATVTIARSTIFGQIQARAIALAENSILMGAIRVCRRQQGCIRFCYVTPGSRTPHRYECQPDLVEAVVAAQLSKGGMTTAERDQLLERERLRVEPEFNSTRYGDPAYGQLSDACAPEIMRGAEDQSEMGTHDLYQPQRAANLRDTPAECAHGHRRRDRVRHVGVIMKADLTRNTFHLPKQFARVLLQQGRVQLDADWNEQQAILLRMLQALAADIIGPRGGPFGHCGFAIAPVAKSLTNFRIAPGRYYVDGLLCENDTAPVAAVIASAAEPKQVVVASRTLDGIEFGKGQWVEISNADGSKVAVAQIADVDRETSTLSLDADVSALPPATLRRVLTYLTQSDFAGAAPLAAGSYLVYLDVWERVITYVEDDAIREVALNGADTAARTKIVSQVKVMAPNDAVPDPTTLIDPPNRAFPGASIKAPRRPDRDLTERALSRRGESVVSRGDSHRQSRRRRESAHADLQMVA